MKPHVRSVRLSVRDQTKLDAVREADSWVAEQRRLPPRKEGAILAAAITAGIAEIHRRTIGWGWSCDRCGRPILSVDSGRLHWVETTLDTKAVERAYTCHGLQIVHAQTCSYDMQNLPLLPGMTPSSRQKVVDIPLAFAVSLSTMDLLRLAQDWARSTWEDPAQPVYVLERLFTPGFEPLRPWIAMSGDLSDLPDHVRVRVALRHLRDKKDRDDRENAALEAALFALGRPDDDEED